MELFERVLVFNPDGSVSHRLCDDSGDGGDDGGGGVEPPPPVEPPVEPPVTNWPDNAVSIDMVILNDSNLSQATVQRWIDVHQKVIDTAFAYDWIHVQLRLGRQVDDFDPSYETPHFLTNGLDVEGAAGYHSIAVNAGGDLDAIAFTDVDASDPDETFGHEIFELAANPTTSSLHQYWGDANRLIMGEVCDPVTRAPHVINGVQVSAWVTQRYLQGDNQEDPTSYDSSRWFGETARVTGPKKRTATGFQIFFNLATRQIEYEFGPIDPSVPWQMQNSGGPVMTAGAVLPAHVQSRCERFYRNMVTLGAVG